MGRRKREVPPLSEEEQGLFRDVYYQYRGLILSTARKVVPNYDEMCDLLQDSYINLMRNISVFPKLDRCETASYIVSTIRRTQIDRCRVRTKGTDVISLDDEAAQALLCERAIVEHIPLDADARLDVMQLFEEISEKERMILISRYLEGCSTEELAEKLNCKPDSVRMVLSRLRKRVSGILKGEGSEHNG